MIREHVCQLQLLLKHTHKKQVEVKQRKFKRTGNHENLPEFSDECNKKHGNKRSVCLFPKVQKISRDEYKEKLIVRT